MGGDISRNLSCILFKSGKSAQTTTELNSPLISVSPPDPMASPNSYLCDTLPQAKLAQATASPRSPPVHDLARILLAFQSELPLTGTSDDPAMDLSEDVHPTSAPSQRKLCPRHKRMADEGTNLKLQQVRDCHMTNMCIMLTQIPQGFGCSPFAGAGGHQRRMGELLGFAPPPASLDSPRSADHVLLLTALPSRRPTLLHHPHRPLHRSPPRSVPPGTHLPRRYFTLPGCSSQQEVEIPCRR